MTSSHRGTWTQMSFPAGIQDQRAMSAHNFEANLVDAVQQFRRVHEDEYVRSPATMDASVRHLIRHLLLNGGAGNSPNVPAAEKLNYLDDRIRMLRHDVKCNYGDNLAPNAFGWCYFMARVLLVRMAASTTSRPRMLRFALERYEMMKRITGCWDDITHAIRGAWRPEYSSLVSLVVLHHGLRNVGTVPKAESCGSWCLEGPNDMRLIYQLEHPSTVVDLDTAYQAVVSPQAAQNRTVHNSLLLLHALHAGEWFRFLELCCALDLTFFQKVYAFGCLTYVRFRAVADTFGKPRLQQKPRLRDHVSVRWLCDKLLFASEEDCVSFLTDLGIKIVTREKQDSSHHHHHHQGQEHHRTAREPFCGNSSSGAYDDDSTDMARTSAREAGAGAADGEGVMREEERVVLMQAGDDSDAPTAATMLERIRAKKNSDDLHEWGLYPPREDFFNLSKAAMAATSSPEQEPQLDLLLLIQQPDGSEQYRTPSQQQQQQLASTDGGSGDEGKSDAIAAWSRSFAAALESNPFNERVNVDALLPRAPSLLGAAAASKLAAFDAIIEHERSRLFSRRIEQQLLREFETGPLLDLQEEMARDFTALHMQEKAAWLRAAEATAKRKRQEEATLIYEWEHQQRRVQQQQQQQKQQTEEKRTLVAANNNNNNNNMMAAINNNTSKHPLLSAGFAGATTSAATSSATSVSSPFGGWPIASTANTKAPLQQQQQQQQQRQPQQKDRVSSDGGQEEDDDGDEHDEENCDGDDDDDDAEGGDGPTSVASTAPPSPLTSSACKNVGQQQQKQPPQTETSFTMMNAQPLLQQQEKQQQPPVVVSSFVTHAPVAKQQREIALAKQQQQQQQQTTKVVFDPLVGAYRWVTCDAGTQQRERPFVFPVIDQAGFTTWAPRLVSELRALYIAHQSLFPGSSCSSATTTATRLAELTRNPDADEHLIGAGLEHLVNDRKQQLQLQRGCGDAGGDDCHLRWLVRNQLRVWTEKVQWCIAVVSDEKEDNPRSVTTSCLSMFHDPETARAAASSGSNNDRSGDATEGDDIKNLCFRTFLHHPRNSDNGNRSTSAGDVMTSPTFAIAAANIRSTELHRAPEIISAAVHGGDSCGVIAVFVQPPKIGGGNGANDNVAAEWLERMTRAFATTTASARNFSSTLRGIVLLADCDHEHDEKGFQREEAEWACKFEAVWRKLVREEAEMQKQKKRDAERSGNRDAVAAQPDSVSLLRMIMQNSGSNRGSAVVPARRRRQREETDKMRSASEQYWRIGAAVPTGEEEEDDSQAHQQSHRVDSASSSPLMSPPVVVVPTAAANVRRALGSAISEALLTVAAAAREQLFSASQ